MLVGDELDRALDGVSAVFHLAGAVSRDPDDAQRMMRLHVDGTRRVLERMAAAGVRAHGARVDVAARSACRSARRSSTRRAPYAEEIVAGWPYYASKIYQERLAFEHGERLGIEVVAVNPSLLLGPGDRRLSSTGDVRKFIKRQIPTIPDGGINFVDARDAARGDRERRSSSGRAGERYLLGGPNWTTKEFFARLGRVANVAPPRLKLPPKLEQVGRVARRGALPLARQGAAGRSDLASRWPSTTGGSTRRRRSASSASRRAIRSSRWSTPSRTCARASRPTRKLLFLGVARG